MAAITPERVAAMQRLLDVLSAAEAYDRAITARGIYTSEDFALLETARLNYEITARTFLPDLLEAYAAATQWRPIATAPKDGKGVLLGSRSRCTSVAGYWSDVYQTWIVVGANERVWFLASHWLPLPAPPVKETPA